MLFTWTQFEKSNQFFWQDRVATPAKNIWCEKKLKYFSKTY
jgi:hypothetical protein